LKCEKIRKSPIGRRGGDRPDRKQNQVRERKVDLANRPPVIKVGDKSIKFKKSVRYLGVWFDQEIGVKTHCEKLGNKLDNLLANLSRLAKETWGLKYGALSMIYRGVLTPTVTYASAVWVGVGVQNATLGR